MKKSILLISFVFLGISSPTVFAQTVTPTAVPTEISGEKLRKEIRGKVKEKTQNLRKEIEDKVQNEVKKNLNINRELKNLKDKIIGSVARIVNGTVTVKTDNSITVTKDGKAYTVNVGDKTKLRRHFWGDSSLSEISVNDLVNVWGKFTDDAKSIINAALIRDLSVQKRSGVFFGTVSSKGDGTFLMQTVNRGSQTVTIGSAKIINRKGKTINFDGINGGDRVRVRGMWDKSNNTITDVAEIKDFTQPVIKTSVTPSVTPTI